jgi:hypothetical protein
VPADDDVRSLVVQLDAAAKRSSVDFATIEVGGGSGAAAPSGTPTAPAAGEKTVPGATPVGPAGFSSMPFNLTFRGHFEDLEQFLARVERFVTLREDRIAVTGRLLRLDQITLQPDSTGFPQIRAQIGATSYLVPATQGLTAGASPQGPAASGPAASATRALTPPTTTATATGGVQ